MVVNDEIENSCSDKAITGMIRYVLAPLLWVAAISIGGAPLAFTLSSAVVPEHYEIRRELREVLFAPLNELDGVPNAIYRQDGHIQRVRFERRNDREALYVLFLNEEQAKFPLHGRGSYIIKRSARNGHFQQIKIFLTGDAGYYARIFPHPQHATMDIYLAEERVYHQVPLPMAFEAVLLAPFAEIVRLTTRVVEWDLLLPDVDTGDYRHTRFMVTSIRQQLPALPDAEDGAMDRHGNLVRIDGLPRSRGLPGFNCSGFAKWVADGLYFPATGRYLDIARLSRKHLRLRGTRWSRPNEQERDPYFGLDWTRNIAAALHELEYGYAAHTPEANDVRDVPFAHYVEDVGYPVTELERILYVLALREPGNFYFGSINGDWGSAPVLRQHFHVVALFPYFDADGNFHVALLERNVETNLDSLRRRYPRANVHLVRARADSDFAPPI